MSGAVLLRIAPHKPAAEYSEVPFQYVFTEAEPPLDAHATAK
jgi:hypothetical protein